MNKARFNEIDQSIKQLDPNGPFILKLNHDALHRELNPEQYNLPKTTAENGHHSKLMKPEPSTSTQINDTPPKIRKKSSRKKSEIKSDKYSKYTKLATGNFFFWSMNSHESVINGWVGRTMFFSNNTIITKELVKKQAQVHKNNEEAISSPKC